MIEYRLEDKLKCVERELRFRRVVYERNVQRERMTQQQADWEIGCMEAIAADYRIKAKCGDVEL